VRGLLRRGEREIGVGRGAVKFGEGAHLLWGPGEHQGGVARAVNPGVMALTPLKTGRLDERLRSAIKEGNQGVG
jgi:hypothetical protein